MPFHKHFNSLGSGIAICQHRSGSVLVQLMAYCLMAPSHYLIQCWLIINRVLWHSPNTNFTEVLKISIWKMSLKITFVKLLTHLSGPSELTWVDTMHDLCINNNISHFSTYNIDTYWYPWSLRSIFTEDINYIRAWICNYMHCYMLP